MARDLRRYARQTNIRLLIGGLLILFIVGDGLIYFIYGREAAGLGLLCMVLGLLPMILVWAALFVLGWIVERANLG